MKNKIKLKLSDNRILEFLDINLKIYNIDANYKNHKYRYATEKDYNEAIDTEVKLYNFLAVVNIQNPEILTDKEKSIIKKFNEAHQAILDQYISFDSNVAIIDEILEMAFCKKVSIW